MNRLVGLWKKNIIFRIIVIIVGCILFLIPPVIINYDYFQGFKLKTFPNTVFSASDLLIFYGSVLSFLGTISLGFLALYQNQQIHEQNLRLENQKYIAENAPVLLYTAENTGVSWKMVERHHLTTSLLNDVVMRENIIVGDSEFLNALIGEIKIQSNDNYVTEYKINGMVIDFHTPENLNKQPITLITEDEYKIAQPVESNSFKLFVTLFMEDREWNDLQRHAFSIGNYSFRIELDFCVKCNSVISEYLCLIEVRPKRKSLLKLNILGEKHFMKEIALIRTKPPYMA